MYIWSKTESLYGCYLSHGICVYLWNSKTNALDDGNSTFVNMWMGTNQLKALFVLFYTFTFLFTSVQDLKTPLKSDYNQIWTWSIRIRRGSGANFMFYCKTTCLHACLHGASGSRASGSLRSLHTPFIHEWGACRPVSHTPMTDWLTFYNY